jgi:hypothetical protein
VLRRTVSYSPMDCLCKAALDDIERTDIIWSYQIVLVSEVGMDGEMT